MAPPPFKFLRLDGWFQFPTPADVSISTSTTTGLLTVISASLGSSVNLSTAAFTDGPSVAQGSSGTWYASGTVTVSNAAANVDYAFKLWDGTNPIAATIYTAAPGLALMTVSLSGAIASPAGNLRISGILGSGASGGFVATAPVAVTGSSALYSTITAVRIG